MKGHGEKLSRKQDQAVAALLSRPTIKAAAEATGVGEVTLWRWLQKEKFQAAYRESRRQVVSHSVGLLQQASSDAVAALRTIVLDGDAPASSRVSAPRTVLEIAVKAVELESMTARVAALELKATEKEGRER